jgi:hypothetical protein
MSEDQKWFVRVGLIVTDTDDDPQPDRLLRLPDLLGWRPACIFQRGNLITPKDPANTRRHKCNGFRVDSFEGDNGLPVEHVTEIIRRLEKHDAVKLLAGLESQIAVNIKFFTNETPPLNFDSDLLRRIAFIGASIDLDVYLWNVPDVEFT